MIVITLIFLTAWLSFTGKFFLLDLSFQDTQEVVIEGEFLDYQQTYKNHRSWRHWTARVLTDSGIVTLDLRCLIGYRAIPSDLEFFIGDYVVFKSLTYDDNYIAVELLKIDKSYD